MKAFNLPADARLKLTKTTPRKEIHGDDHVQAISLRLRWETSNEALGLLHPQLKDMLFWKVPAVEAQEQIAGLIDVTPNLRVPIVTLPLKLDASFTGYQLTIDHGIDDSSALELYVCGLDKFAVDAKEGGSVFIDWSLSSNKEITPELVGLLCSLEGDEIIATLTPPAAATGDAIDGSVEAFERDHPSDNREAGDLFAEAHGPIPDGCVIRFKPGMKSTEAEQITLEALECVSRVDHMAEHTFHQYGPEIAQLTQLRSAITRQINKRTTKDKA